MKCLKGYESLSEHLTINSKSDLTGLSSSGPFSLCCASSRLGPYWFPPTWFGCQLCKLDHFTHWGEKAANVPQAGAFLQEQWHEVGHLFVLAGVPHLHLVEGDKIATISPSSSFLRASGKLQMRQEMQEELEWAGAKASPVYKPCKSIQRDKLVGLLKGGNLGRVNHILYPFHSSHKLEICCSPVYLVLGGLKTKRHCRVKKCG